LNPRTGKKLFSRKSIFSLFPEQNIDFYANLLQIDSVRIGIFYFWSRGNKGMPGKFEIKTAKNGKVHFNLKASNGQVILSSETYDSRKSAENGIESVRKNSQVDARFERKTAKDGSAYFVLKAANGEPIGKSEMYKSVRSMENGIASVKKHAPDAVVADAK
jgi:hypothetical protein